MTTTVVGRGISLWIAVQSLAQLDAVYGRARAHVLRDNVETQLYYRPSNQETAEYLERCLGRKSGFAQSPKLRRRATGQGRKGHKPRSKHSPPLCQLAKASPVHALGLKRREPAVKADDVLIPQLLDRLGGEKRHTLL